LSAGAPSLARRRGAGAAAAERQPARLRPVPRRPRARAASGGPGGADRMSSSAAVSALVQLVGGIALAPLLPGLVQHRKGRLQGRRGPTPLQPYRELRRLWRKSAVDVAGAGPV